MDLYAFNYKLEFEKLFKHYLEPEFHDILYKYKEYKIERKTTEFVDEYLASLINGYINITASSELDSYIMELLEDEWFLEWPLIRWAYASRVMNGVACRRNMKKALGILLPLAKEGNPGAIYDIGCCFRYSGMPFEYDYNKGICLWILSCKLGYHLAYEKLKLEYDIKEYKKLNDELRFFFLRQIIFGFVREHGLSMEEGKINPDPLNETSLKELKRIMYEYKSLEKLIIEKAWLRETTDIFWDDEDNLYKINF